MKKDIEILKKRKESLWGRLFGLKKKVEEETDQREYKTEIKSLETEIKTVDDLIFDGLVQEAKTKVEELSQEAVKLVEDRKSSQARIEEIDVRLIEIFYAVSAIIPKKRLQTKSSRTVKMVREVEYAEFTGLFKSSELMYEGGRPVGHKLAPSFDLHKKVLEIEVPAFPSQIERARSLGYELKVGEKVPEEALDDSNSVMVACFPTPDVLSQ